MASDLLEALIGKLRIVDDDSLRNLEWPKPSGTGVSALGLDEEPLHWALPVGDSAEVDAGSSIDCTYVASDRRLRNGLLRCDIARSSVRLIGC